jgi:hypothetical protein
MRYLGVSLDIIVVASLFIFRSVYGSGMVIMMECVPGEDDDEH